MTGASDALAKLRRLQPHDPAITKELEEIRAVYLHEMSLGDSSYWDCFHSSNRKRMFTGMTLQILQQLTGLFPLAFTKTSIF